MHAVAKIPKLVISGYMGVMIGTRRTVLPHITHARDPRTFCMDNTCKGRRVACYKNPEVLGRKGPRSGIKLRTLYCTMRPFSGGQ